MKRFFIVVLAAVIAAPALFAAPAKKTDTVTAEIIWGGLDQNSWQMFMFMGAIKRRMGDKLDIKITPLVQKKDGKWFSMRGEGDIVNIKRLAVVSKLYPGKTFDYLTAKTYSPGDDGWKDAAAFSGIDPARLEQSVSGKEGEAALESAYKSAQERKIDSTELRIGGAPYSGEVSLTDMFAALNNRLPKAERFPLPSAPVVSAGVKSVKVWVVTGPAPAQEDKQFSAMLKSALSSFTPEFSVISQEKAAQTPGIKDLNADFLPFYAVETSTEVENTLKSAIDRGLARKSGNYLLFPHSVSEGVMINQPRQPGKLELYTMSMCPFGSLAETTLIDAMTKNLLPPGTTVEVHFILNTAKDNDGVVSFSSMHGSAEWEEDLRQLIIAKNYPDKFWKYLAARNVDYRSSLWDRAAVAAGIDPQEIMKAFDSSKPLLEADAARGEKLGINSSPTFVWEGRVVVSGTAALKNLPGFDKIQPAAVPPGASATCAK